MNCTSVKKLKRGRKRLQKSEFIIRISVLQGTVEREKKDNTILILTKMSYGIQTFAEFPRVEHVGCLRVNHGLLTTWLHDWLSWSLAIFFCFLA